MIRRPQSRPGFTLLEVLLASTLALLLLAGLYVVFDLTLTQNQVARVETDRAGLIRAVIKSMALDLNSPLAPLPPMSGGGSSVTATATDGSTTTDMATAGTTATTGTATTATATDSTGTTTAADGTTTETTPAEITNLPLHAGVIGSNTQVTLFISRVPSWQFDPAALANPDVAFPADLRKVTYYMGPNGGLCRQDRPWVLADGVGSTADPDLSTADADLIAPEVVDLTFEYFDGSTWLTDWDGQTAGADGAPIGGPPRAVRATFTFEFPGRTSGTTVTRRIQHVFPVRAACGLYVPPTTGTETTEPTTTTGTGTSATTTGTTTTGG